MTSTAPPLASIYDRSFFQEYGAANRPYVDACDVIAAEIYRRFQPATVVDWGCGAALHAGALKQRGVDVIAVDGVRAPADLASPDVDIVQADLRTAQPNSLTWDSYDLSLCIDVLEHIDEADSVTALNNVLRGAQLAILSCAPPGQGGHHHVNERPRRYWTTRLAQLGWTYDRRETGDMERTFLTQRERLPFSWMYHNLCVYRPA